MTNLIYIIGVTCTLYGRAEKTQKWQLPDIVHAVQSRWHMRPTGALFRKRIQMSTVLLTKQYAMPKPLIVAELSCSHTGSLQKAFDLVEAAWRIGADAIKLQTWTPGKMTVGDHQIESGPWKGKSLKQLYEEAHTPWEWHASIFECADYRGLTAFSSVFDLEALEFLESINCPIYKISSFECIDLRLVAAVAATKKPLIISVGMASLLEIAQIVDTAHDAGCKDLTLMHCVSAYPTRPEDVNLATMVNMRQLCSKVGFSDHTRGIGAAVLAAGLGAYVIEKHLQLIESEGLDRSFAVNPFVFRTMVDACREAAKAYGVVNYDLYDQEKPQYALRRGMYFAQNLPAGTVIRDEHIITARPASLSPVMLDTVIGNTISRSVNAGDPVTLDVLHASEKETHNAEG